MRRVHGFGPHVQDARRGRVAVIIGVLVLFLVAFWSTTYISDSVFDGMPHVEDEHAFLFQAKVFATARLFAETPPHPSFFPTQFVLDRDGKRFGKYPPGYPALLSLGVIAGRPHLVNPILGAATLVVVFLIGRELYGTPTGALAAALGVVSPFFLMISGSFMSHSTTLFFLALFVLFFIKSTRSQKVAFPVLAGACLGMAFLTRQLTAIGIALPFVVYGLIDLRRGKPSFLRYGFMGLAFAPFALFLLYFNWALTGDPFLSPHELWWSFDKIGFDEGRSPDLVIESRRILTMINLDLLSNYLFGWPWRLSLAFLAVPFVFLTRKLWDWLLLAAAASLVVAYTAYWTSGEMYGPRYFYEALPMLLLLTARGVIEFGRKVGRAVDRLAAGSARASYSIPGSRLMQFSKLVRICIRRGVLLPRDVPAPGPMADTEVRPLRHRPIPYSSVGDHQPVSPSPLPDGDLCRPSGTTIGGAIAFVGTSLLLASFVYVGITDYLAREMAHYKGWYGVTAEPLKAVRREGLSNALVFVSSGKSWTEFASVDFANSPGYNSDVVLAVDQGRNNERLVQLYPGRKLYKLVGTIITPYVPPE